MYSKAIQVTVLVERFNYMLGNFMWLLSSADFSSEIIVFEKNIFQEYVVWFQMMPIFF